MTVDTASIDDVKVWIADLDSVDVVAGQRLLSAAERERAQRSGVDSARRAMIARRTLLRSLLGAELGVAPEALELERRCDRCAKLHPARVVAGDGRALHWSTSSAGSVFVMAAAPTPVGIDIEPHDATSSWQRVAQRYFTAAEVAEIGTSADTFAQFWAFKEAFLKGEGVGLAGGLDRLCCATLHDVGGAWLTSAQHPSWRLAPLRDIPAAHAGAIAVHTSEPPTSTRTGAR